MHLEAAGRYCALLSDGVGTTGTLAVDETADQG
eukprot:SAG31_NODE_2180_length_6247_cov_4.910052_2_plen_33_part_00